MKRMLELDSRIVSAIRARRGANVDRRRIAKALGVPYPTVVNHIKKLIQNGYLQEAFEITTKWDAERVHFWVSIQTQYVRTDRNHRIGSGAEALNHSAPIQANYQFEVCQKIKDEIARDVWASRNIEFSDIHVLIGGEWDLLLHLTAQNVQEVANFVTGYLRTQEAIVRTSTAWSVPIPAIVPQSPEGPATRRRSQRSRSSKR
jgi:DNA-binding Lrp family transcriptional regulator